MKSTKNYHVYEAPKGCPLIGKLYVDLTKLPSPAPQTVDVSVTLPA
jgi:hypothetical protein